VPFTRAGCDVGAFSVANIEFENTGSDINTVFGPNSPQAQEAQSNSTLARADFVGIAIHCSQDPSSLCNNPNTLPAPDTLADEPNGYTGFQALYGNKYAAPALNNSSSLVINDLNGNPITDSSSAHNPGFPGFSPFPWQTLGYLATMLESGVPVVYGYIRDAHDNWFLPGAPIPNDPDGTFGPGEQDYAYQLSLTDAAFNTFFTRLQSEGITPANTLFVITSDENDHFVGAAPAAPCDGFITYCTYPIKGEVQAKLEDVFRDQFGITPGVTPGFTGFGYDFDSSPGIWINGNPGQTDPLTRTLERAAGQAREYDPVVGGTNQVMAGMADQAEQALLHMITSDPQRTPTFILFSNPDYFFTDSGSPNCGSPLPSCINQTRNFAWNHGDFQSEITHTWLGMAGPNVRAGGSFGGFTDHTDIRPTILALAGLVDDYGHDGRVLFDVFNKSLLPASVQANRGVVAQLAEAYKQINAPLGKLGRKSLTLSTKGVAGTDAQHASIDQQINNLKSQRDGIAQQMLAMLEGAFFSGQAIDPSAATSLINQANALLASLP
jgi:hypothetical protein